MEKTGCLGYGALGLVIMILFAGCLGCARVEPGYVGVKVNKLGSEKGVGNEVVDVGWHWVGFNYTIYHYPVFENNYVWTSDTREGSKGDESIQFQNSQGLSLRANIGIRYKINRDKVDDLFQRYRRGVSEITSEVLRIEVRDALNDVASDYEVTEIIGEERPEFMGKVFQRVHDKMKPLGIDMVSLTTVSNFVVPPDVEEAIDRKIKAVQQAQQREYELRESVAQARKDSVEAAGKARARLIEAQAEAEANRQIARSLSAQLVRYEMAQKWNGELSKYSGSGANFLFDGN